MSGRDSKGGDKESCGDGVRRQWDDFLGFLYDPRKGTVMGRTGKSWAKILIFYLFYYGFLAALFAISVTIVRGTLDEYTPTYQTRLQTPGVGVQPKIPSNIEQTSDIFYTVPKTGEDKSKNIPYIRLVNQTRDFLTSYSKLNQTNVNLYQNCSIDAPMQLDQDFKAGEGSKSCTFDMKLLGPCGTEPYGYDEGKPCLYIKLNRIISWFPVGYTDLSVSTATESKAPQLSQVLKQYNQTYKPNLMYAACYDYSAAEGKKLTSNGFSDNKYYPSYMGLPFVYYPYHGNLRQPGYLSPLVAVQLNNVKKNDEIKIGCKVYARNIEDNLDMGEGFFTLKMNIKE